MLNIYINKIRRLYYLKIKLNKEIKNKDLFIYVQQKVKIISEFFFYN